MKYLSLSFNKWHHLMKYIFLSFNEWRHLMRYIYLTFSEWRHLFKQPTFLCSSQVVFEAIDSTVFTKSLLSVAADWVNSSDIDVLHSTSGSVISSLYSIDSLIAFLNWTESILTVSKPCPMNCMKPTVDANVTTTIASTQRLYVSRQPVRMFAISTSIYLFSGCLLGYRPASYVLG